MNTIKFCKDCDNLLYPREDPERKNLIYGCQDCDYTEPADNDIVYHKEIRRDDQRTSVLNSDPILPRTKSVRCPNCRHGEAVFFQAEKTEGFKQTPPTTEEDGLSVVFVCCNPRCTHRWED